MSYSLVKLKYARWKYIETLAQEEAEAALREKYTQEKREYAREWAKKKRARQKAERESQKLLEPPDSELTPEELKARKYERRKERERAEKTADAELQPIANI